MATETSDRGEWFSWGRGAADEFTIVEHGRYLRLATKETPQRFILVWLSDRHLSEAYPELIAAASNIWPDVGESLGIKRILTTYLSEAVDTEVESASFEFRAGIFRAIDPSSD